MARTNVAPVVQPPDEQVLHAFSYTIPVSGDRSAAPATSTGSTDGEPTFITSGAPEAPALWESAAGVDERLLSSLDAIGRVIEGLGRSWDNATTVDVYVREGIGTDLAQAALARIGPAARHGLRWYLTKTPLLGPFLECDARGVRHEVQIDS